MISKNGTCSLTFCFVFFLVFHIFVGPTGRIVIILCVHSIDDHPWR